MAIALPAPRHLSLAFALVAILIACQVRAQDAPAPAAATGQKGGQGPRGAATPAAPPAAEQHKLPPDSTTKQSLDLPGRNLLVGAYSPARDALDVPLLHLESKLRFLESVCNPVAID